MLADQGRCVRAPARLLAAAESAFGRVDVLVANHARSSTSTLEELTAAELDLSYAVNTRAIAKTLRKFVARGNGSMAARRQGGRT